MDFEGKQSNNSTEFKGEAKTNWKVFRHDTEAGRLLSRLYGVQPGGKPQISYPPLRKQISGRNANSLNSRTSSRDPQVTSFDRAKAFSIAVPKVGQVNKTTKTAIVDLIPKRRTEVSCRQAVKSYSVMQSSYRPPNQSSYATDREKERLNEIFTYKGGRALPVEMISPSGSIPSEVAQKSKEQDRAEKAIIRRRDRLSGGIIGQKNDYDLPRQRCGQPAESDNGNKNTVFDQILNEIKDRRQFQMKMEETGEGSSTRQSIANEIASRIHELKQIDPERATGVMQVLYQK